MKYKAADRARILVGNFENVNIREIEKLKAKSYDLFFWLIYLLITRDLKNSISFLVILNFSPVKTSKNANYT